MRMVRVMVTGSRDWEDRGAIFRAVILVELFVGPTTDLTLVSGACPTGADMMAEEEAEKRQWHIERHPADWNTHGKRAGFLRNMHMVNTGPHLVLAFQRNRSKGTENSIELARSAHIPVWIWSAP